MNTNYKHLIREERTLIQLTLERGCAMRAIALSMDCSASSNSRELAHIVWCDPGSQPAQAGRPAWQMDTVQQLPTSVLL